MNLTFHPRNYHLQDLSPRSRACLDEHEQLGARLRQISDLKKQTLKLNRISDINSTFKFLSSSNFQFLSCASYLKSHVVIRHVDHLQILSHIRTIRYLQCTLAVENNRYDNYKVGVAQCDIVNSICVAFIMLYYDV